MIRSLVPLAWAIWAVLVGATLYTLVAVFTERNPPNIGGRGLGVLVVLFVLALLAAAAFGLHVAARRGSTVGIVVMTLLIAYPGGMMGLIPAVKAFKEWRWAAAPSGTGEFQDPALAGMARAIGGRDDATLARLLGGQAPPDRLDGAGNDLLGYALSTVRHGKGSAAVVRVLLDAGADPRTARLASGEDVLTYLIPTTSPHKHEVMRLLLEHGANPNASDKEGGDTPLGAAYLDPETIRLLVEHGGDPDRARSLGYPLIVRVLGAEQWESALYLIERGVDLEPAPDDLFSVDYYLDKWRESVNGAHPEGWERVKAAIAARRSGGMTTPR